jgi:hypothetical protein
MSEMEFMGETDPMAKCGHVSPRWAGKALTYPSSSESSRRRRICGVTVVAVVLLLAGSVPVQARQITTLVPLEHWSYELIQRLEAAGHLSATADGIRPFSRMHMAQLAMRADSVAVLTRIDTERLGLLLQELDPEIRVLRGDVAQAARRLPLFYGTGRGSIHADLLARQQTDSFTGRGRDGGEHVFRNRLGGVVEGDLLHQIAFRIAFEQTREQGSRDYSERQDVYEQQLEAVQLKGSLADFHQGAAYFTFGLGLGIEAQVGKDRVAWGPAPDDNLGLSSNAPAFDMVRLRTRLGVLELVSLHGSLQPCPDRPDAPLCSGESDANASYIVNGMSRVLDRDKWIAAHRLEAAVTPSLDLGFQEVVIYGDRGPEPAYLNPLMFYWAAQSYMGDKDNVMMAVDADWRVHPGLRWWATYAIDDLKKLEIFSNDFSNKFSLQSGLMWTDPLGLEDVDIHADYVRIEPWIYTHKIPINTFRHFDSPLGHSLGPNSDRWRVKLKRRWSRDMATSLSFSRSRHGDNVLLEDGTIINVGGDLHRGWRPGGEGPQRQEKVFLDGNVGRRSLLKADLDMRLRGRMQVGVAAAFEWGDNVRLPPDDGPATPLTGAVEYGDGRQLHLSIDMRYGVF